MTSGDSPNYNPFNPAGRYNIETYLYNNKQTVLGFVVLFIILLFGLAFFVWDQGRDKPRPGLTENIRPPPPKYGNGPYGYGLYAPPRELFENPPDVTD